VEEIKPNMSQEVGKVWQGWQTRKVCKQTIRVKNRVSKLFYEFKVCLKLKFIKKFET